jgi:hypothetical protein
MRWNRRWFRVGSIVLALLLVCTVSYGQTWNEFFKQKKTQKKYLLQQIAALKVYGDYLKKGYELASGGLSVVRDISDGEFSLHNIFVSGLKRVSPAVRNDVRVTEIVALQVEILRGFGELRHSDFLSAGDLAYIHLVQAAVVADCFSDLEELLLLVTSGKLEMRDDERLGRLAGIYSRMLDKSGFARDFCGSVSQLISQRKAGQDELGSVVEMFHLE